MQTSVTYRRFVSRPSGDLYDLRAMQSKRFI